MGGWAIWQWVGFRSRYRCPKILTDLALVCRAGIVWFTLCSRLVLLSSLGLKLLGIHSFVLGMVGKEGIFSRFEILEYGHVGRNKCT